MSIGYFKEFVVGNNPAIQPNRLSNKALPLLLLFATTTMEEMTMNAKKNKMTKMVKTNNNKTMK